MEISCKSEYALLALLELADYYHQNEPLQIRQIAAQQQIPDRYLEQLLAILRRNGFVRSQRGAKGGYLLTREPWKITLLEVIRCIEGITETKSSDSVGCPSDNVVLAIWAEAQEAANAVLQDYTLQDLVDRRKAQRPAENMYYI